MSRPLKWLTALVIIIAMIALVVVFTPTITRHIIRHQLSRYGFLPSKMIIKSIGLRRTHIIDVHFKRTLPGGTKIDLKLPDIQFSYSLKHKKLNGVTLKNPIIHVALKKSKEKSTATIPTQIPLKYLIVSNAKIFIVQPKHTWIVSGDLNLKQAQHLIIAAQGKCTLEDQDEPIAFKLKAQHQLSNQTGKMDFALVSSDFSVLPFHLKLSPTHQLKFTQGKLEAAGTLTWTKDHEPKDPSVMHLFGLAITSNTKLISKNLALDFNKIKLNDLNGKVSVYKLFPIRSAPYQQLTAKQIGYDNIQLNGLSMNFDLNTKPNQSFGLLIHALTGKIAGGTVSVKDIQLGNGIQLKPIIVTLNKINIAQFLQSIGHKTIKITGTLHGTLPIHIGKTGITIQHGLLSATGGGLIQYKTPENLPVAQQNPTLKSVLNLLTNFQYKTLTIQIDQMPDSEMATFKINALGANPAFYHDHPVNLNLLLMGPIKSIFKYYSFEKQMKTNIRKHLKKV